MKTFLFHFLLPFLLCLPRRTFFFFFGTHSSHFYKSFYSRWIGTHFTSTSRQKRNNIFLKSLENPIRIDFKLRHFYQIDLCFAQFLLTPIKYDSSAVSRFSNSISCDIVIFCVFICCRRQIWTSWCNRNQSEINGNANVTFMIHSIAQ